MGEVSWNKAFPEGFKTWQEKNGYRLTSYGQLLLIDKINEIIDYLNRK